MEIDIEEKVCQCLFMCYCHSVSGCLIGYCFPVHPAMLARSIGTQEMLLDVNLVIADVK